MKGNRAVLTAVVILVLIVAGWWLFKRSNRGPSVDLLSTFASAQKQPASATADLVDVDLNGDKKRAIFTQPPSRIRWKVRVPDDGWLKVDLGMKPEAWEKEGNGVWFYVGVSDGHPVALSSSLSTSGTTSGTMSFAARCSAARSSSQSRRKPDTSNR